MREKKAKIFIVIGLSLVMLESPFVVILASAGISQPWCTLSVWIGVHINAYIVFFGQ